MPSVAVIWADGGYAGRLVGHARQLLKVLVDIVRKREGQRTFEVLPRRWVVERTLSWISRCRRLAHDYERLPEHSEAMVQWAMVGLMARRLAPAPGRRPWETNTFLRVRRPAAERWRRATRATTRPGSRP